MNVDVPANAQGILGVYFDLTINGSSSLLLLLHNAAKGVQPNMKESISRTAANVPTARPGHLSFGAASQLRKYTDPISLLAQVDNEDFVLMPNASGIVTVRRRDMDPGVVHNVRVIAPMTEKYGGVVEFEGLWLDHGGRLLRVEGSQLEDEVEQEDAPYAENAIVGKQHGLELKRLLTGAGSSRGKVNNNPSDINEMTDEIPVNGERKKLLEILTDMPGSVAVSVNNTQKSGGSSLLGGVMGWEYLIGDMFGADHVSISVPGMCLMQDCIRATGTPIGLGDVFFRSNLKWQVLNMGGSDFDSFTQHQAEYNKTSWELLGRFEDTYVSLIKAIRDFGYPKHPDFVTATASSESSVAKFGPANIPIFIMRPFRGQFEHATQGVVNRLRAEGDKAVFWLDTSGWLDPEDISSNDRDFFLDDTVTPARWVLTERGNQRVAIFLHMHVCRYLASEAQRCAFLEPEVYQGKVFDPEATMLDRYIEREKGQKLREMFWENE
ncbi:MAG: hypothetical protein M1833_006337 [Piccolia ochrophora]|nr:MAG: hypothetical protein M1833_006337 [Piccolia ochrophora]